MGNKFWGLPFYVWGSLCIAIAVVYMIFVIKPRTDYLAAAKSMFVKGMIRWAHPAVWMLFALDCFLRAASRPVGLVFLELGAGLVYISYLFFFFREKFIRQN